MSKYFEEEEDRYPPRPNLAPDYYYWEREEWDEEAFIKQTKYLHNDDNDNNEKETNESLWHYNLN